MMLIKKNVAVISKSFDKTNKERNAVKYKFRKCDTLIKGSNKIFNFSEIIQRLSL